VFSYLYLWTVSPDVWAEDLPELSWPGFSAVFLFLSALLFVLAKKSLAQPGQKNNPATPVFVLSGALALIAAVICEGIAQWQFGVHPTDTSYAAMVYMACVLNGQLAFAVLIMALFVIARHFTGKLDSVRFASLENTCLLAWYTVGQALISLLLIHGFPRIINGGIG